MKYYFPFVLNPMPFPTHSGLIENYDTPMNVLEQKITIFAANPRALM